MSGVVLLKIAQSILGVFVGYAVFALSAVVLFHAAGRDPHAQQDLPFTAGAILYGMAFAAVGGLIAAHRGTAAHFARGDCGSHSRGRRVCFARLPPRRGAIWSQVAAMFLMAPSVFVGGIVAERLSREKPIGLDRA